MVVATISEAPARGRLSLDLIWRDGTCCDLTETPALTQPLERLLRWETPYPSFATQVTKRSSWQVNHAAPGIRSKPSKFLKYLCTSLPLLRYRQRVTEPEPNTSCLRDRKIGNI